MSVLDIGRVLGAVGFIAITAYLVYAAVTLNSGNAGLGALLSGLAALVCLGAIREAP